MSTAGPSEERRQAGENGRFPFVMPWDDASATAVDVSSLNPAPLDESRGLTIRNGHFYDTTGRRVRFVGTNLAAGACFPRKEDAERVAAHLHKLGFNCVRLHEIDSPWAEPSIFHFAGDAHDQPTDCLDPQSLDHLDYLVYQLKLHGIYVDINLHVSRRFTALDGFPDTDQLDKMGRLATYLEPGMIARQKLYAQQLLTHLNPYTRLRYRDDPVVALVEITNEDSVFWPPEAIPKLPDHYRGLLAAGWNQFLAERYDSTTKLLAAWGAATALEPGQTLEAGTIPMPTLRYGPTDAKPGNPSGRDYATYLMEVERRFSQGMYSYLKDELGVRAAVICTQADYGGVAGAWRESHLDWADMHAYWQHPEFPSRDWDAGDYRIGNTPMVREAGGGTLFDLAKYRLDGKPFTVTEYDHPAPNEYAAEAVPMVFAYAAWQDWDGIFFFAYNGSTHWDRDHIKGFFDQQAHPGKLAFLPSAAALFLRGYLGPAPAQQILSVPKESIAELMAQGDAFLAWERAETEGALDFLGRRSALRFVPDGPLRVRQTSPGPPQTRPLSWQTEDPSQALFTVDTPHCKVLVGFPAGRRVTLGDLTVSAEPTPRGFVSLTLVSLDGQPIARSRSLLLTVVDKVENVGLEWNADRTFARHAWERGPTMAEGVTAHIELRTEAARANVHALDGTGARVSAVPCEVADGRLLFCVAQEHATLWYEIKTEGGPSQ